MDETDELIPLCGRALVAMMSDAPEFEIRLAPNCVMALSQGVGRFYLIATEAGRPLYLSLAFQAVADLSAWVLGHSTQAPGAG